MRQYTDDERLKAELLGSLLSFTKVFYKIRTGRDFELSNPIGRESHFITISRYLTKVFNGEIQYLIINCPPRYAKTEMLINFIAWAIAHYPDSNFIYTSYSHSLAKKQTQTIREIISLPSYRKIFGVSLSENSSAKDNFETNQGGSVYAAGAQGTITGRGAGIKGSDRFGGAFLIDDIHKPDEAQSDVMREGTNEWFWNTAQSRANSPNTPFIYIGQRVHESDLAQELLNRGGWELLSLPALDVHHNALYPEMHDRLTLEKMERENPYVFSAQYQQNPQPSGGGIFKPEWFVLLDHEPEILATFITCDTAETDKDYNDATVFSFWGIYKIKEMGVTLDILGLHWIDCLEIRCEPKDLESEFRQFYSECLQYKIKPYLAAIEKKSTGSTLLSLLSGFRGLEIRDIERTRSVGSKTARFLQAQPYVASKRVSFTKDKKHTELCIEHCRKITANNSHRFDDIADTLYDAIKIGLIDEYVLRGTKTDDADDKKVAEIVMSQFNRLEALRSSKHAAR